MVLAGAVRVDGRVVRSPRLILRPGQRIDAQVRSGALASPVVRTDRAFRLTASRVLFEDAWLLAVDKPPGLPTHRTADPRRDSLVECVRRYLSERGDGRDYLAVHQRLDRDTSGVVLFALDPAANPGLAQAFGHRGVDKRYLALVEIRPGAPGGRRLVVREPLGTGAAAGRVEVMPGGLFAETEIRVLERSGPLALVEVRPSTGRKHQIRAHLAHLRWPILGDGVYGGRTAVAGVEARRPFLHAARLALPHPLDGRSLEIASDLPDDFREALLRGRFSRFPGRAVR